MGRPYSRAVNVTCIAGKAKPWRCQWRGAPRPDGTREKLYKFFATEAEALDFKTEFEETTAQEPQPIPQRKAAVEAVAVAEAIGPETVRGVGVTWLRDIVSRKKASTERQYEMDWRVHVLPFLGEKPVASMDRPAVAAWLSTLASNGRSWDTQSRAVKALSACLSWAIECRHLTANPCFRMTKSMKPADEIEPEPNPLSKADMRRFLTWVETGRVVGTVERQVDGPKLRGGHLRSAGWPELYPLFLLLFYTGMRRGEAAALKWDAVFLDGPGTPHIYLRLNDSPALRAKARKHGTVNTGETSLKGKRAHRVDLPAGVVMVLRELARTRRETALRERRELSPYVCVGRRGQQLKADSGIVGRVFRLGMEALGLAHKGHTIHTIRDTFATVQLMDGAKLLWVSRQCGHRDVAITARRYARWIDEGPEGYAEANRIDLSAGEVQEAAAAAAAAQAEVAAAQAARLAARQPKRNGYQTDTDVSRGKAVEPMRPRLVKRPK